MKKKIFVVLMVILLGVCCWVIGGLVLRYKASAENRSILKEQNQTLENIIKSRREKNSAEKTIDPFGEDKIVRILFIGLDNRIGQENGHCDAIQLVTIDNNSKTITITAVPRGTYSPLPPGKGATSTDYYVSNACGLGGLAYGIEQIEKILGVKTDYLVVVGFSETVGILRNLKLPTTETLQWLRNRHGYTIGEPQRAHNHSTFIKQMLLKFVTPKQSSLDTALHYLIYKLIKTDLTFTQTQQIINAVANMDIDNQPEKIQLTMRPAYAIQDILYDSEHLKESLEKTIGPIRHLLSSADYPGMPEENFQINLLDVIEKNKTNLEFVSWAYKNSLWLQIEDTDKRLNTQYDLLYQYTTSLSDKKERELILADYILEMENRGEIIWQEKGKELLKQEIF